MGGGYYVIYPSGYGNQDSQGQRDAVYAVLLPSNEANLLHALTVTRTLYLDSDGRKQYQTNQDVGGLSLHSEEISIKQVGTGYCAGLLHLHYAQDRTSIPTAHVKTDALSPGYVYAVTPDNWPQELKTLIYQG